jgi:hypothetical protein|tara:strand:+ start:301 stop:477 length:177 start_codon:yes stop_codon:yes gene_type:complete
MKTTFFGIIFMLSTVVAVGSIEDCQGACMGNENWLLFAVATVVMIVSALLTVIYQYED